MTSRCPGRAGTARRAPLSERLLRVAALVIGWRWRCRSSPSSVLALTPTENVWPHLVATVLPGYVCARLRCCWQASALITFVVGTAVAWLVTMCSFPLRPRVLMGLAAAHGDAGLHRRLYLCRFPELRRPAADLAARPLRLEDARRLLVPRNPLLGGAIFVLSMVLYPYVFLTARASFIRQPARRSKWRARWARPPGAPSARVALPLARPGHRRWRKPRTDGMPQRHRRRRLLRRAHIDARRSTPHGSRREISAGRLRSRR